jgi:hypothetical protein
MPLVGFVSNFTANPNYSAAFRRGLGEVGYIEGRDVAMEYGSVAVIIAVDVNMIAGARF